MLLKHVLLVFALVLSVTAIPAPSPQDPIMDLDTLITDETSNLGLILKKRHHRMRVVAAKI